MIDNVMPKKRPMFTFRIDPKLTAETLLTMAELLPDDARGVQCFYYGDGYPLGFCGQSPENGMMIDALVVPLSLPQEPEKPGEQNGQAEPAGEQPDAGEVEQPADTEPKPKRRGRKLAIAQPEANGEQDAPRRFGGIALSRENSVPIRRCGARRRRRRFPITLPRRSAIGPQPSTQPHQTRPRRQRRGPLYLEGTPMTVTQKLALRLALIVALPESIMLERLRRLSKAELAVFRKRYGIRECCRKGACAIRQHSIVARQQKSRLKRSRRAGWYGSACAS